MPTLTLTPYAPFEDVCTAGIHALGFSQRVDPSRLIRPSTTTPCTGRPSTSVTTPAMYLSLWPCGSGGRGEGGVGVPNSAAQPTARRQPTKTKTRLQLLISSPPSTIPLLLQQSSGLVTASIQIGQPDRPYIVLVPSMVRLILLGRMGITGREIYISTCYHPIYVSFQAPDKMIYPAGIDPRIPLSGLEPTSVVFEPRGLGDTAPQVDARASPATRGAGVLRGRGCGR